MPIPCRKDNYAYLVWSGEAGEGTEGKPCVVVDASESAQVEREIERRGLELRGILTTHHHHDHVGGNLALQERWSVPVFAHESEQARVPGFRIGLRSTERFEVAGLAFTALHVPGHTSGALAYFCEESCFTGDTLFCAGCGRLAEGTAAQLFASLESLVAASEALTRYYTGHEYTLANLEFAAKLEPERVEVRRRLDAVKQRRARGEFCASARLSEELETNPFLRVREASVVRALGLPSGSVPSQVFAALRSRKDQA